MRRPSNIALRAALSASSEVSASTGGMSCCSLSQQAEQMRHRNPVTRKLCGQHFLLGAQTRRSGCRAWPSRASRSCTRAAVSISWRRRRFGFGFQRLGLALGAFDFRLASCRPVAEARDSVPRLSAACRSGRSAPPWTCRECRSANGGAAPYRTRWRGDGTAAVALPGRGFGTGTGARASAGAAARHSARRSRQIGTRYDTRPILAEPARIRPEPFTCLPVCALTAAIFFSSSAWSPR